MRVVIVPGNGCTDVSQSLWYGWLRDKLVQSGVEVGLENMPDPHVARETAWLPFMKDSLRCGVDTIVVGHSSGAEAAMRFAEKHEISGMILVSACVTDLATKTNVSRAIIRARGIGKPLSPTSALLSDCLAARTTLSFRGKRCSKSTRV